MPGSHHSATSRQARLAASLRLLAVHGRTALEQHATQLDVVTRGRAVQWLHEHVVERDGGNVSAGVEQRAAPVVARIAPTSAWRRSYSACNSGLTGMAEPYLRHARS